MSPIPLFFKSCSSDGFTSRMNNYTFPKLQFDSLSVLMVISGAWQYPLEPEEGTAEQCSSELLRDHPLLKKRTVQSLTKDMR